MLTRFATAIWTHSKFCHSVQRIQERYHISQTVSASMSGRGKGKPAGKKQMTRSTKAGLQVNCFSFCCLSSLASSAEQSLKVFGAYAVLFRFVEFNCTGKFKFSDEITSRCRCMMPSIFVTCWLDLWFSCCFRTKQCITRYKDPPNFKYQIPFCLVQWHKSKVLSILHWSSACFGILESNLRSRWQTWGHLL